MKWVFEHLGGYELMRDGTQSYAFESYDSILKYIDGEEIFTFWDRSDLDLLLFEEFKTDLDVHTFIESWYEDRYDDGGGWGRVEVDSIDGLLEAIRAYNFILEDE